MESGQNITQQVSKVQDKLSFNGVRFVHVDFTSMKPIDPEGSQKTSISILHEANFYKNYEEQGHFTIVTKVMIESDGYFNLNLVAIGGFKLSQDIDEKVKNIFINTSAPAIVFPYIRSFVSFFSSSLGHDVIGSFNIAPHVFNGEITKNYFNEEEE